VMITFLALRQPFSSGGYGARVGLVVCAGVEPGTDPGLGLGVGGEVGATATMLVV